MLEILQFVFAEWYHFAGVVVLTILFGWWSVVLVTAFKPVVISMNHTYNNMDPMMMDGDMGDEPEEDMF